MAGLPALGMAGALAVAVPLWIAHLAPLTAEARRRLTTPAAAIVYLAGGADAICGRYASPGEFNALAVMLAGQAFDPGGANVAGLHFCAGAATCGCGHQPLSFAHDGAGSGS